MNQPPQPARQPRPQSDPKAQAAATAQDPADGEEEAPEEELQNKFLFFNVMPSWMVSFLTHIAVIIILAIIIMPSKKDPILSLESGEQTTAPVDSDELDLSALEFEESELLETEISEDAPSELTTEVEVSLPEAVVELGNIVGLEDSTFDMAEMGQLSDSSSDNETGSRSGDSKAQALKKYGGNASSEAAVEAALKWIIDHQLPDGGWNFDHTIGPGNHRGSPDPGHHSQARNGATAMALLPLLGYGNTHKAGTYKRQVEAGLKFLMTKGKPSGRGISYLEPQGTMYSHGLVSIVFCEAFAMTKDPYLKPFAQGTIWFIEDAQDPNGGGWRYQPRQAGDTSAVGWQLMALKSGKIGGLEINPKTLKLTEKFLDSVSINSGAFYGYTDPPPRPVADARTAIGLLCRMYMGWQKDSPGIVDGTELMSKKGPDVRASADVYYNYYASQVMKHIGGRQWKDWNPPMRDSLVASQDKKGVTAGSWNPAGGHGDKAGGRLYVTSMNCMTLEVYYRYLPLYGDKAADDEFRLE